MKSSDKSSEDFLFNVLSAAHKTQKGEELEAPETAAEVKKPAAKSRPRRTPQEAKSKPKAAAASKKSPVKPVRKSGKSSDPGFVQSAFWLSRKTSAALDLEIAKARSKGEEIGDRSEVVEGLLMEWLKGRK